MIHLIWSIVNVTIVLYFLYLIVECITKRKRVFKSQFKFVSIFIMVIGMIQIISANNSEKTTNQLSISKDFNKKNDSKIEKVILESNLTFDINMYVKYTIAENEFRPIESNSYLSGFVSGYAWEFNSIQTNKSKSNSDLKFRAIGILKWNLFGITVFSELKTF